MASRRDVLARIACAAGVAAPVLGVLQGDVRAWSRADDTDLAVLDASLVLEHYAIALYSHALGEGMVPAGLRSYAVEFRGDHLGHRDTQVALAEERGRTPPRPLGHYDFRGMGAGDDALRHLLEIEQAAERAYLAVLPRIAQRDHRLSAAFILVDEVRHLTVWRRALGLKIY